MQDAVVGLLAVVVGTLLCFQGHVAMRVLIPVWGAFAGFLLGAGVIAAVDDDGFLRSLQAWIVGLAVAALCGLLAFLYYEASVLLAMAAVGFVLGAAGMVVLGGPWSWSVVLIGVAAGVGLALVAIAGELPTVVWIVLTSLAGACTVAFGLMLIIGALDTSEFQMATTTERLDDSMWWYGIALALAIAGIIVRVRHPEQLRWTGRAVWVHAGGRPFRSG